MIYYSKSVVARQQMSFDYDQKLIAMFIISTGLSLRVKFIIKFLQRLWLQLAIHNL